MSDTIEYDGLAERILGVYSSCSKNEQQHLYQILTEMSQYGYSQTLEQLWLADFKEVPVSIDEFICNPRYLGETTRNGEAVYPFWRETVREIFGTGNQYNEIVLSGATRIGKTSTMTMIMTYMLYRLMLYRDPHTYFKKKAVSRFTIGFANLTQALASGVCYREFNDTLKECPWFNDHGTFSRSERNFYYIPEGDKIDIVAGSDASNFLGMQLWACLVGDTQILTDSGFQHMRDLTDSLVKVAQYDYENSEITYTDATVVCTKYVTETIRIWLDDSHYIEGTPDHLILLTDGTYKPLCEITLDDDISEVTICHT